MRVTILPLIVDHTDQGLYGQGVYCGLSPASEVFLIFTTQLYQYMSVFLVFVLITEEPEVVLPKYPQTAILHAAHIRRVVNSAFMDLL